MRLQLFEVNFKARDDSALGRFWAAALGWRASSGEPGATSVDPVGSAWPDPAAVRVEAVAVPDPETAKDRAHIDLATTSADHHAELVTRLRELGATPAPAGAGRCQPSRTALADPEGNVFCVREPRDCRPDTGPIAAVVVHCADPRAMARFWSGAMDWTVHDADDDHALLRTAEGVGPCLELLRTPHPSDVRHRAHLDLAPHPFDRDRQAAEVARLETLGAALPDTGRGGFPWQVMTDPEGNEFCVLGPA
ncbi:VOC family protein [Streptomyces lavendulocolor]|uniref:VOC family protein n=1 Tax=Streptomyces lavendulocolor TaxID=67316 RepID=UPI00340557DB